MANGTFRKIHAGAVFYAQTIVSFVVDCML